MTHNLQTYYAGQADITPLARHLAELWLTNKTPVDRLRFLNRLRNVRPLERRCAVSMRALHIVLKDNAGMGEWLIDWIEHGERHICV